ncbi:MAG TPA: hypothetical protein VH590_07165 [Ktedonobacterales bacterium]
MAVIQSKTVLVFGGFGLAGSAISRLVLAERPAKLVVSSLRNEREEQTLRALRQEFPETPIEVEWGNIFVREALKDFSPDQIRADPALRQTYLDDLFGELTLDEDAEILAHSTLYQMILRHQPQILIDCINTATAFAYLNVYESAAELRATFAAGQDAPAGGHEDWQKLARDAAEKHLATLYIPALVRHMQLLFAAIRRNPRRSTYQQGAEIYLKVGTTGTGGMGFNIPYTHGEERPSRVLLSKSAVAGAHTMLLFLMGRTPDAPIVKEVKPAAAIAWGRVDVGPIIRRNRPIPQQDCPPEAGMRLEMGSLFDLDAHHGWQPIEKPLEDVYVDTGENGLFSREEFAAITANQQMEFVTAEDVAQLVLHEIHGANTGHDVVAALDGAVVGPTYRAGKARSRVLARMDYLSQQHHAPSVAFEMLGPPRLSKLLFEGWLLKQCCGGMSAVVASAPQALSERLEAFVRASEEARIRMISVRIPILLADGRTLLCGTQVAVPGGKAELTPERLEQWAQQGWVDLRPAEMARWQGWLRDLREQMLREAGDPGSGSHFTRQFTDDATWEASDDLAIGEVVSWIFNHVEGGYRIK